MQVNFQIGVKEVLKYLRNICPNISFGALKSSHSPMVALRSIFLLVLLLTGERVYADVIVFIEYPIDFLGHISATGHAALLIEDLCSDDHVHVRWCRADEDRTVISRYKGIDGYDWVAMPPGPYLFAVDSFDEIPETASANEVEVLRARYRRKHPGSFKHDPTDDSWVQLLGASYRRRIIGIRLRTAAVQDKRLMQWLNGRPDRTHFNFFFSNCADFARQMLDVIYPGAVHRNIFFDFGMTTPKQLESSLHHYAMRHPGVGFDVYELPQVPGNISRSGRIYGVAGSFAKAKPYLLPLAILDPIGIGGVAALGLADHRYVAKAPPRINDDFFFQPSNTIVASR